MTLLLQEANSLNDGTLHVKVLYQAGQDHYPHCPDGETEAQVGEEI